MHGLSPEGQVGPVHGLTMQLTLGSLAPPFLKQQHLFENMLGMASAEPASSAVAMMAKTLACMIVGMLVSTLWLCACVFVLN